MRQHRSFAVWVGLLLVAQTLRAGVITFEVENNSSTLGFSISIVAGLSKVRGQFTDYKVVIVLDEEDLTRSSVTVRINVLSINTSNSKRDADLHSLIFFDMENYREIIFKSTRIERDGAHFIAVGELTIKGVQKTISLPFEIKGLENMNAEQPVIGISSRYTLNRLEYGVGNDFVHRRIPQFLGMEVQLEIDMWTRIGKRE